MGKVGRTVARLKEPFRSKLLSAGIQPSLSIVFHSLLMLFELANRKSGAKMSSMIIEILELNEISKKLDPVILLLEKLLGNTAQNWVSPTSVQEESPSKHMMTVREVAEYLALAIDL